jgi:hypothetical protein
LAYETARGKLSASSLETVGTAFIAAGAALFGIVLAGLAVLGAFAGGQAFQTFLGSAKRRRETYTEFYWVAALAVLSVLATVALLCVAAITSNRAALAVAFTIAAVGLPPVWRTPERWGRKTSARRFPTRCREQDRRFRLSFVVKPSS